MVKCDVGKSLAPVIIFAYSRPKHLELVLQSLRLNTLAPQTQLFIFCDFPKSASVKLDCDKVRHIAHSVDGFLKVNVIERQNNFGLAKSIIDGVTYILDLYGRAIILEDDLVVSPFFLKYMNEGLNTYKDEPTVAAINAYLLPLTIIPPETFFLKGADCWGWATWGRAWSAFNPNSDELLRELRSKGLEREFDLDGTYPYVKMLEDNANGLNQSWAIRWQASVFLKGMMTLYPGRSLVQNIGNDNSGVHCNATSDYEVELSDRPIEVLQIPVVESSEVLRAVTLFHKRTQWFPRRLTRYIFNKIKGCLW